MDSTEKAPISSSIQEVEELLQAAGVPPARTLAQYIVEVLKINEHTNITGAKSAKAFIEDHILDVWCAFNALSSMSNTIADVGSGAGLPGIPLAIFNPLSRVYLIEVRKKKSEALNSIVSAIGLGSRVVVIGDVFERGKGKNLNITEIWMRAFLPGEKLGRYLSDNFSSETLPRIILMKGPSWAQELDLILNSKLIKDTWKERLSSSVLLEYELKGKDKKRALVIT